MRNINLQKESNKEKNRKKVLALFLVLFLLCGTTLQAAKSKQISFGKPSVGDAAIIEDEAPALAASVDDITSGEEEPTMTVTLPTPEEVANMGEAVNPTDAQNQTNRNNQPDVQNNNQQNEEMLTQIPTAIIPDEPVALQHTVSQLTLELGAINTQISVATSTSSGSGSSNSNPVTETIQRVSEEALAAAQLATDKMTELSEAEEALNQAKAALETEEGILNAAKEDVANAVAALETAQAAYDKKLEDAKAALKAAQDKAVAASNVKYAALQALAEMTQPGNQDAFSTEIVEKFNQHLIENNALKVAPTVSNYYDNLSTRDLNSTGENYGINISNALVDIAGAQINGLEGTKFSWRIYEVSDGTDGKTPEYHIYWVEEDISELSENSKLEKVYKYNTATGNYYLTDATVSLKNNEKVITPKSATQTEVTPTQTGIEISKIVDTLKASKYDDSLSGYNQEEIEQANTNLANAIKDTAALNQAQTALGNSITAQEEAAQKVITAADAVETAANTVQQVAAEVQTAITTATEGGATVTVNTQEVSNISQNAENAKTEAEASESNATQIAASTPSTISEESEQLSNTESKESNANESGSNESNSNESNSSESASSESSASESTSEESAS